MFGPWAETMPLVSNELSPLSKAADRTIAYSGLSSGEFRMVFYIFLLRNLGGFMFP